MAPTESSSSSSKWMYTNPVASSIPPLPYEQLKMEADGAGRIRVVTKRQG